MNKIRAPLRAVYTIRVLYKNFAYFKSRPENIGYGNIHGLRGKNTDKTADNLFSEGGWKIYVNTDGNPHYGG